MIIFGKNKLYDHVDKLNLFLNRDKTLITAEIDMTNVCNNKCPDCAGFKDNQVSLTLEEAKDYIDQLSEMGLKALIFTGGGEPLCHEECIQAMTYAKSKGLEVGLITNGLAISDPTELLLNCTWIRFSLDAGSESMYEKTHGMINMSFQKVLNNIRATVNLKEALGDDTVIGTAFLTSEETKHEMHMFADLSKNLGVDYAQFRPYHRDQTDVRNEIEECRKFNTENFTVVASYQKYKHFGENTRGYTKCLGMHFRTVIAADSKVYSCCHHRSNEQFCLGDLKQLKFKDIWNRRHNMIEHIDVKQCIPFCILDKYNKELENICSKREHNNFL